METMKTYKAVLLAVLGLGLVVTGAYFYMKHYGPEPKVPVVYRSTTLVEGQVTRMFEGENKLVYAIDIPETATSSVTLDGALVKVTDADTLYVAMYMSYEGGRGYSSLDYINNVIAPRIPGLIITGTTTIGSVIWTVAQSAQSEWHVGQVGDGQWLLVAESPRALHEKIVDTIDTLTTK